MSVIAPVRPPRLPADFLEQGRRQRLTLGVAQAFVEHGYFGARIREIVRHTSCARKTFYETFGGKQDAARGLLAELSTDASRRLAGVDLEASALGVLAVELAAVVRAGGEVRAVEELDAAGDLFKALLAALPHLPEPMPADDPRRCCLPPGRLFDAAAAAIAERGYYGARVSDITRRAAVSRRTFYHHFDNLDEAALAVLEDAAPAVAARADREHRPALYALAAEVVSAAQASSLQSAEVLLAEAALTVADLRRSLA